MKKQHASDDGLFPTTSATTEDSPGSIDGIRVGIGGWVYLPWRDNFYPAGLVQRRELEYASRQVTAIEINGTYYGTQKPSTYARWRDEVPDGFLFSAKAPKRITQSSRLAATGSQIEDFIGGIASLGDALGPLVWQFDRHTRIDRAQFEEFLGLLPTEHEGRRIRHVLDVRDPGFVGSEFLALARRHRMATVFTDSDEYPSFADLTTDFVYARLMRSESRIPTGYPPDALRGWAGRARAWAQGSDPDDLPHLEVPAAPRPPRPVFVFFIGSAKERNPAAATALLEMLGES
jgi:uncharacterized protein YecE (DUF72 family)